MSLTPWMTFLRPSPIRWPTLSVSICKTLKNQVHGLAGEQNKENMPSMVRLRHFSTKSKKMQITIKPSILRWRPAERTIIQLWQPLSEQDTGEHLSHLKLFGKASKQAAEAGQTITRSRWAFGRPGLQAAHPQGYGQVLDKIQDPSDSLSLSDLAT